MKRAASQCKFISQNTQLQRQNSIGRNGAFKVSQNYGVNQKMILKTLTKSKTELDSLVPNTTVSSSIFETCYTPAKENNAQTLLTENEKAIKRAKVSGPNLGRVRRTREDRRSNKLSSLLAECQTIVNSRSRQDRKARSKTANKPARELKGIQHLVRRHLNQLYTKIPLKIKIQENSRKYSKNPWAKTCNI